MGKHNVIATIFDRKGRTLTQGENCYRTTHPLQAKFAIKAGKPDAVYLHAEIKAISKLKRGQKPHRIFVERYKKNGNPGNAKPCAICEAAIKSYGIKYVEHTV